MRHLEKYTFLPLFGGGGGGGGEQVGGGGRFVAGSESDLDVSGVSREPDAAAANEDEAGDAEDEVATEADLRSAEEAAADGSRAEDMGLRQTRMAIDRHPSSQILGFRLYYIKVFLLFYEVIKSNFLLHSVHCCCTCPAFRYNS